MILPLGKTRSRLAFDVPNDRAKRRGGKAPLRSQIHNPRPLERPVGRRGRERKPGLHGFCSLLFILLAQYYEANLLYWVLPLWFRYATLNLVHSLLLE